MVVKMVVSFLVLRKKRHLVFRKPQRDHNFNNHPYTWSYLWTSEFGARASGMKSKEGASIITAWHQGFGRNHNGKSVRIHHDLLKQLWAQVFVFGTWQLAC